MILKTVESLILFLEIVVGPTERAEGIIQTFFEIEVAPMERPEGMFSQTVIGFSTVSLNSSCVHGAPTKLDFVEGGLLVIFVAE